MQLPKRITIHEVGPREGFQSEKQPISTEDKVRLVDLLSECGFAEIETVSFVNPKRVPQMADAEQVIEGIRPRAGTRYTAIYMNAEGIRRAISTGKIDMEGYISVSASDTFSRKNANASIEEVLTDRIPERIATFAEFGVPVDTVMVLAAFGCNYEGDIPPERVLKLIDQLITIAQAHELPITTIQLADTMGWATPVSVRRLVSSVRERRPEKRINLHLHDTRGLGLANVFAGLELGVDDFDSAVAGLGGCPFAGFKGASGNIATEDVVHLCAELGIETGIDLPRLLEVAREAERIVGRELPGKVMRGGPLGDFRSRAAAPGAA